MPDDPPPGNPRARFLQSVLICLVAVLLSLLALRVMPPASEWPDSVLTLIVLVVFLSLPLAAVILWLIARRRS